MDVDYLIFKEEIKVGNVITLFIDPYSKKFNKSSDFTFFPGFEEKLWYRICIILAVVIWLLCKFC